MLFGCRASTGPPCRCMRRPLSLACLALACRAAFRCPHGLLTRGLGPRGAERTPTSSGALQVSLPRGMRIFSATRHSRAFPSWTSSSCITSRCAASSWRRLRRRLRVASRATERSQGKLQPKSKASSATFPLPLLSKWPCMASRSANLILFQACARLRIHGVREQDERGRCADTCRC
jgi:hypothetical protein